MVTEIPWGDGTSDKIYLTYTAASGSQTILVSSDANAGPARTRDITFVSSLGNISRVLTVIQETNMDYVSITWNDTCITFNDTAIAYPYEEEYIVFVDSVVEQTLLAKGIGDGIGIKPSDAAKVTSMSGFWSGTGIESFDEFRYFTGMSASGSNWALANTGTLKYITIPSQVTTMPLRGFATSATYASLERITFENDHPITFNQYAFQHDNTLQAVHIKNLDNWLHNTYASSLSNPLRIAHHLYLNGQLVTSLSLPDDMSTIPNYFMQGMSDITGFTIPSRVTSIGQEAFSYCTGLSGDFIVPSSVTSFSSTMAIVGCSGITNLYIHSANTDLNVLYSGTTQTCQVGNGTGELHIYGNVGLNSSYTQARLWFKKIIIDGDFVKPQKSIQSNVVEEFRIGGDFTYTGAANQGLTMSISPTQSSLKFIEMMGSISSSYSMAYNTSCVADGAIIHLGYDAYTNNSVPCAPSVVGADYSRVSKIYVGKGQSASEDNNILSVYMNDASWSTYSSKLDTWYNYVNDPDANQDYIN